MFDVKVNHPGNDFFTNSSYETYQYCMKIPDTAVLKALTHLTTYSQQECEQISQTHQVCIIHILIIDSFMKITFIFVEINI